MALSFFTTSSILKKFLIFNFIVFLVLSIFTFLYLRDIQPNLVSSRSKQHDKIINNTTNHISRLNIEFDKTGITEFLLSTRFLFQNLDRVQIYDLDSILMADTDTLDLAQNIFSPNESIQETPIDISEENLTEDNNLVFEKTGTFNTEDYVKKYSKQDNIDNKLVIQETINNNFYVITIDVVKLSGKKEGYIVVSEIANDILVAVDERKNFVLRSVFIAALVILIFSVFLNK